MNESSLFDPEGPYRRRCSPRFTPSFHSEDATAARTIFTDVLQWPFVSEGDQGDAGTGTGTGGQDPAEWLIFGTGPSELGVHPTAGQHEEGRPYRSPRHHSSAGMCDDLQATMAELSGRGAVVWPGTELYGEVPARMRWSQGPAVGKMIGGRILQARVASLDELHCLNRDDGLGDTSDGHLVLWRRRPDAVGASSRPVHVPSGMTRVAVIPTDPAASSSAC